VRRLQHRLGERPGRIEPVAVEADIIFAPLDPLDREPVDEIGVGRPADPRGKAIQAASVCTRQASPPMRAVDRARAWPSSQSGASSSTASSRLPSATSGRSSNSSASTAGAAASTRAVQLGHLGLEAVAGILRGGPGIDRAADRGEQLPRSGRRAGPRRSAAASRRRAARRPPAPPCRAQARRPRHRRRRPSAAPRGRAAARASGPPARRSSGAARSSPGR
jgi:hypothetical protein